jgi:Uma2 family endonuclease
MVILGINHAEDISIIDTLVSIFCARKGIQQRTLIRCNFTKANVQECQPDLAFYLDFLEHSPPRSDAGVDLNIYPPPALVVELAAESINDELGDKRMLYESLGMQEYWVIDVSHIRVIAFAIADEGSRRVEVSQVLPGLNIKLVEKTLERSRLEEKSATTRWLWSEFGTKLKD